MTDNEKNSATDNEIIKALECHASEDLATCEECPLFNIQGCAYKLSKNALDLINRQKEQIEALIAGQKTLQKYIAEKDAEIVRLRNINTTITIKFATPKEQSNPKPSKSVWIK